MAEWSTDRRWTADFWFDPACPYTRLTARWLLEAATVRPIEVRWHVMSLAVLNEHRDDDPEGDPDGFLWIPVRIGAAVRQEHGQQALGDFYAALWNHGDDENRDRFRDFAVALREAGLPAELVEAGTSTGYDDAVRASHEEGIRRVGDHVGTPVIAVSDADGRQAAFFGPVISRVPTGERAARLWDGILLVAGTPGFHELKGTAQGQIA